MENTTLGIFSRRLTELMVKGGVNQDRLSQAIDVSQATISKWQRGEAEPRGNNVALIAKFFNVTTDFLLTESEPSASPRYDDLPPVRDLAHEAPEVVETTDQIRHIHEKNPEGFRAVKAVIATIYGKPSSRTKRAAKDAAAGAASTVKNASPKRKP